MEKQVNEFVKNFGLDVSVAHEITSSHTLDQIETILDFLSNYGQMIKFK